MKKYIVLAVMVFMCILFGGCGDNTAPTIEGIEKSVEVQCGTDFNLKDYVNKQIKVKDDSEGEPEITINCSKKVYNKKTGSIDTQLDGNYKVKVSAKDNANNVSSKEFTLKLEPVHITKENKTPIIYDGKYAKVQLKEFRHGDLYGTQCYSFEFEVENRAGETVSAAIRGRYTSINKRQIDVYVIDNSNIIGAGNIATVEQEIDDVDIPDEVGEYKQIKTCFCINSERNEDEELFCIPMMIDIDAAD